MAEAVIVGGASIAGHLAEPAPAKPSALAAHASAVGAVEPPEAARHPGRQGAQDDQIR